MNQSEYEHLKDMEAAPAMISVDMLSAGREGKEGTLLWGFTGNRDSFHVYLKDGKLHRLIYRRYEKEVVSYESGESLEARILHPNKRVYPEASSFEFIRELFAAGEAPNLRRFDEKRKPATWHGFTYEQLCDAALERRRPK